VRRAHSPRADFSGRSSGVEVSPGHAPMTPGDDRRAPGRSACFR
jgi:hypothetical protein